MSECAPQCDPLAHAREAVDKAWDDWLVAQRLHEKAGEECLKAVSAYLGSYEHKTKLFNAWESRLEELKKLEAQP